LDTYKEQYLQVAREVVEECERNFGTLQGTLGLDGEEWAQLNWVFLYHLLNTVEASTLAIRGSEKSVYGKLFERVITYLGSVGRGEPSTNASRMHE
jgi:hypothetical protein